MRIPGWPPRFAMLALTVLATTPLHAEPPEGFEPYTGLKDQLEIGLPKGWSVFDPNALLAGGAADQDFVVAFSSVLRAKGTLVVEVLAMPSEKGGTDFVTRRLDLVK